jgi:hypothetical protein
MRGQGASGAIAKLVGGLAGTILSGAVLALDGETLIRQGAATTVTIDAATARLPLKLDRAGHYKLTTNITVPSAMRPNAPACAIEIAAVGVTLDLNGFALIGENMQARAAVCVLADSATVINGTIMGFSSGVTGITSTALAPNGPSYLRIENNRFVKNAHQIRVSGKANLIKSNTIGDTNGYFGIDCSTGCAVIGNVIMDAQYPDATYAISMHSGLVVGNFVGGYTDGLHCTGDCGYSQNTFVGNGKDVVGAGARPMNPNAP